MSAPPPHHPDDRPELQPAGAGAWIDRSEEAERIIRFLRSAPSNPVVLYGEPRTGKSALIRRWVIPRLVAEGEEVFYGQCDSGLPQRLTRNGESEELIAAARRAAILFIDDLDRLLEGDSGTTVQALERLLTAVNAGGSSATLVLIVNGGALKGLFALGNRLPQLLAATLEMRQVGLRRGLESLNEEQGTARLEYEPEFLETLERQAQSLSPERGRPSTVLIQVLDREIRLFKELIGGSRVELSELAEMGGVEGILRRHLDSRLEHLGPGLPGGRETGLALLEAIVSDGPEEEEPDLAAIAARLDLPDEDCRNAFEILRQAGLIELDDGCARLSPPEAGPVVATDLARQRGKTAEIEAVLRRAWKSWMDLEIPLPRERFEPIHRQRRQLRPSRDEMWFLLHSALPLPGDEGLEAARYWQRRLGTGPEDADLLLASLYDSEAGVREKAAALLGVFELTEVRDQLLMIALQDPEPAVRRRAVESLGRMPTPELRQRLVREVESHRSLYRLRALEALQIFRDEETIRVLEALVADPQSPLGLRSGAIEVLSRLEMPAAVDALLHVALTDEDPEDRSAACQGLATTEDESLLRRMFQRLRTWHRPSPVEDEGRRGRLGQAVRVFLLVAASLLLVAVNLYVHAAILAALRRYRWALGLTLIQAAAVGALFLDADLFAASEGVLAVTLLLGFLVPTRILLLARRERNPALGTLPGVLGPILFAVQVPTTFLFIHGLAHGLTRRYRRGVLLLALELLAVGLALALGLYEPKFDPQGFYLGPGFFDGLFVAYWALVTLLFVGSWLFDVLVVFLDTVLLRRWLQRRERRDAVYRRLLANPQAGEVAFAALASDDEDEARWARRLLTRHGAEIPPELLIAQLAGQTPTGRRLAARSLCRRKRPGTIRRLREVWPDASPAQRQTIASILSREPSQDSLEALQRLWSELTLRQKLRYFAGLWHLRIRLWPKTVITCVLLASPLALMFFWEGVLIITNPSRPQLRSLHDEERPVRTRIRAAEWLVAEDPESLDRVIQVFGNTPRPEVKLGIAQALVEATETDDLGYFQRVQARSHLPEVTGGMAALLTDPTVDGRHRLAAIQTLRAISTPEAVEVLQSFVAAAGEASSARDDRPRPSGRDEDLYFQALAALGQIATPASVRALQDLATAPIPKYLQTRARAEASVPFRHLEQAYANGDYQAVIDGARDFQALASSGAVDHAKLAALWGKALYRRSEVDSRSQTSLRRSAIEHLEAAREGGAQDPEVEPVLAQAYAAEAEWLITIDELPEAQELVDKATAIDPSLPTVHAVRAAIALVLGRREEALASFARADELDPTDLWAYQGFELVRRGFHAQRRDRDGARALETLQGDFPGSIYPGLNLAYVYQEYLSAEDPQAFEQAHQAVEELQRRHPYPFLQALRVETLVTTGRYDDAVAEAGRLVREGNLSPDTVFNLHLLAFTSQILAGDLGAAEKELSRLETAYLTLPEDFSNPWSFAGLERYVQGQGLPQVLEGILLSLPARTRERRTAEEDKSLFQNIRSTLEDPQQSA